MPVKTRPVKKMHRKLEIPPLPDRLSNTAELRQVVDTITCFDDSREVSRKFDEWRKKMIHEVEIGCIKTKPVSKKNVNSSKKPILKSERKKGKVKLEKISVEPKRSCSFIERYSGVRKNLPKGFEFLLDKIMREVLLVKPANIKEYIADYLEAELTRTLVVEHLRDFICPCLKRKDAGDEVIIPDSVTCEELMFVRDEAKRSTLVAPHPSFATGAFPKHAFPTDDLGDLVLKKADDLAHLVEYIRKSYPTDLHGEPVYKSSSYYRDMFLKSQADLTADLLSKTSSYYRDMFLSSQTDITTPLKQVATESCHVDLAQQTSSYFRDKYLLAGGDAPCQSREETEEDLPAVYPKESRVDKLDYAAGEFKIREMEDEDGEDYENKYPEESEIAQLEASGDDAFTTEDLATKYPEESVLSRLEFVGGDLYTQLVQEDRAMKYPPESEISCLCEFVGKDLYTQLVEGDRIMKYPPESEISGLNGFVGEDLFTQMTLEDRITRYPEESHLDKLK